MPSLPLTRCEWSVGEWGSKPPNIPTTSGQIGERLDRGYSEGTARPEITNQVPQHRFYFFK